METTNRYYGLLLALIATVWLWMDFVGLLLSVVSTYFYFGWAGTPLLVPKIFLIALAAFSGPLWYRLFRRPVTGKTTVQSWLFLMLLIYGALTLVRHPAFFAWAVVLGAFAGSLTLMAILRRWHHFPHYFLPLGAILLGYMLYLFSRLLNFGVATIFGGHLLSYAILLGLIAAAMFLPAPEPEEFVPARAGFTLQIHAIALGLLIGLGVGLIFNLHIWSALTPQFPAALYFFSLGGGILLALFLTWSLSQGSAFNIGLLFFIAGMALHVSLGYILDQSFQMLSAPLAHSAGALGITVLWMLFIRRFWQASCFEARPLPVLGLQIGFVAFLLILAIFLLQSNPIGFRVALIASLMLVAIPEMLARPAGNEPPVPQSARVTLALLALLLLPAGLLFLQPPAGAPGQSESGDTLTVMSTNIRYGWTDDYRYAPHLHPQWLASQPRPDILGLQEVNKGHTSASYMDLYAYYQHFLPGQWRYADANFGFGNALHTRLKLLESEGRKYQARDMLRRSCLRALVEWKGKPVEIYLTHVSHLPPPNAVRQAQVKELIGWLKASPHPWIVIADFNARPQDPEIQALLEVASPVFRQQPQLLAEFSFPSLKPSERIDYIFFSPHFELLQQQILDTQGTTDHRPVRSELRLKAGS